MAKFKMIALTSPVPGKETEFNDWYNNVHLPQLVTLPGMKQAQRYELVTKMIGADANQYLAVYDIECDDAGAFLQEMGQAAAAGKLTQSDAADLANGYTALFRELAAPVVAQS